MSDFVPRLTDEGIEGNPYWYSRNKFYNWGYGLPNCTCYAFGRFWEIADPDREYINEPTLSGSNAEYWWDYNDGYERGDIPALGAVLCLADGAYSGDGHVAIVEQINDDGSILTSESGYNAYYFEVRRRIPPDYHYNTYDNYRFQGFIYNPYAGDTPVPPGGKKKKLMALMMKRVFYKKKYSEV